MIETHIIAAALGGSGALLAKFLAFRLRELPAIHVRQSPPPLPVISQSIQSPEIVRKPVPAIEQSISPQVVRPEKAVQLLIRYLQDSKCTGVFAASEIDEYWQIACEKLNLFHIPETTIRATLQGVPGVYIGRKQLGIEYREVRQRTGKPRATLYRIPDRTRSAGRSSGSNPGVQTADVAPAGQCLGSDEKPSQVRRAA